MAPKQFTSDDVQRNLQFPRIYCDKSQLVYDAPEWRKQGRIETSSGYGARLNSGLKIHYNGRLYRIYITNYGNAGSSWFKVKGERIFVE